jgi:hypothetical protein
MKTVIILSLLLSFNVLDCTNQNKKINQSKVETSDSLNFVKIYYFDSDSIATLEILKNKVDNYILLRTKYHGSILSIAGEGNIDFEYGILRLDTVSFTKNEQVYILPTYVYGSTYGALVYFLIYKENDDMWQILRIPFDRLDVKDINKDGLSEIVQYAHNGNKIVYTFKNGIIVPIKY